MDYVLRASKLQFWRAFYNYLQSYLLVLGKRLNCKLKGLFISLSLNLSLLLFLPPTVPLSLPPLHLFLSLSLSLIKIIRALGAVESPDPADLARHYFLSIISKYYRRSDPNALCICQMVLLWGENKTVSVYCRLIKCTLEADFKFWKGCWTSSRPNCPVRPEVRTSSSKPLLLAQISPSQELHLRNSPFCFTHISDGYKSLHSFQLKSTSLKHLHISFSSAP